MGLFDTIGKLFSGESVSWGTSSTVNLTKNMLTADKAAYIGEWIGAGTRLHIKPDGSIEYSRQTIEDGSTNTRTVTGPINGFDGASFTVGVLGSNTRFNVEAPPSQNGNGWTMRLNGEELRRMG